MFSENGLAGPETLSRHRRSIFDQELKFKLEAPSVDWRKVIGSKDIGASFGVIMVNLMSLTVCKYYLFNTFKTLSEQS